MPSNPNDTNVSRGNLPSFSNSLKDILEQWTADRQTKISNSSPTLPELTTPYDSDIMGVIYPEFQQQQLTGTTIITTTTSTSSGIGRYVNPYTGAVYVVSFDATSNQYVVSCEQDWTSTSFETEAAAHSFALDMANRNGYLTYYPAAGSGTTIPPPTGPSMPLGRLGYLQQLREAGFIVDTPTEEVIGDGLEDLEGILNLMGWNEGHVGKHQSETPIWEWENESSKAGPGGRRKIYTALLFADGCLSCDCQGWTVKKPNKNRGCKHTEAVRVEAATLTKQYKAGNLPRRAGIGAKVVTAGSKEPKQVQDGPTEDFDRHIEL